MKKTLKLIPAFAMLLVSAILVSTTTFAWFSMNKNVTATGMTVQAKSDNIFLQIRNSNDVSANAAKTQASAFVASSALYPTDYKAIASADGAVTWGTQMSNDPTLVNYTDRASLPTLSSALEPQHVWTDTFKVWVSDNAAHTTGEHLVLTSVTATDSSGSSDMTEALRVLVVGADGAMIWANTGAKENSSAIAYAGSTSFIDYKSNTSNCLYNTVPMGEANAVTVTVYIYFCGNDDSVTTANAQTLNELNVELRFGVN